VAGFALLWWMLVCCWSKSIVQAELARYVLASGDTYLRALNRIPGRVPWQRAEVSWTLWFSLLAFVPGLAGMGGILGAAGQSLNLLFPSVDSRVFTLATTVVTSVILGSGSYRRLERSTLVLVAGFTLAIVAATITMQFTAYRIEAADLRAGLEFGFPAGTALLALAVYGATGVNSAEISTYTYWCIEKGYPSFIGARRDDPSWPARARGWLRVLQSDVWITLAILTCATLPFYLLGAGVLHRSGKVPAGLDTLSVLSGMFTATLGPWSLWLFGIAAFCILYSSVLSGFGGISRLVPDYLVEFGFLERADVAQRTAWIRACGALLPALSFLGYLVLPSPATLLSIGALAAALLLPIQSGATLWLQRHYMDRRFRPGPPARALLGATFAFQAVMAIWIAVSALHLS